MSGMYPDKKLYIFDMDGTIYLGDRVFPFAVEYIHRLRADGRRVLFFTNNASRDGKVYFDRLTRMGFAPREGEILTSGDVTARFLLTQRRGKTVFLLGTESLKRSFGEAGITLSDEGDIVVSSFDTELTYAGLERACTLIRGGAEYLCTHPDLNCPTENGFIPDSGSIAAAITASTGVAPRYFGKPNADTAEMIFSYTGIPASDACVFGDRLYTDVALGKNSGMTSVLVLSGETTRGDLEGLPAERMPDLVIGSIADLLTCETTGGEG
ncbi:MAG: HAD-IIA family hydrolase [Clostridia bacterium]|nr:HAD-IIA family hydrolase [Clostridia bacterium]